MNNYGNNFNGGFNTYGMFYQPPQQITDMTQGLDRDELQKVRSKPDTTFTLKFDEVDLLRSYCTHRDSKQFTIVSDDEGYCTCTQCGTRFKPFEGSTDEAKRIVEDFVNLAETAKIQNITLPKDIIRQYYQIMPFVKKLPAFFDASLKVFNNLNQTGSMYMGQEQNGFNLYTSLVNPMAGNGYYDPAMNQYGFAGQQFTQPQYNMNMGMQQPQQQYNGMNMGMGMPQPQYNMNMNMGMQPQQQPYVQQNQQVGNPFDINCKPAEQQSKPTSEPSKETVVVSKTLTD